MEIYTGFDRLTREEESNSEVVSKSKQMEYRVWDYLEQLDMKYVDFKTFIEDSLRVSSREEGPTITSLDPFSPKTTSQHLSESQCSEKITCTLKKKPLLNPKVCLGFKEKTIVVEPPSPAINHPVADQQEEEC